MRTAESGETTSRRYYRDGLLETFTDEGDALDRPIRETEVSPAGRTVHDLS